MLIAGDYPTIIQLYSRGTRLVKTPPIFNSENRNVIFAFAKKVVGSGAPAYLINGAALSLALEVDKLDGAPDWPPWAQKVNMLCIYPWMFNESSEGSTVSDLIYTDRKKYLMRRFTQFLGIHYFRYHEEYDGIKNYLEEEIILYILYISWKIFGVKYFNGDSDGPQIL